MADLTDKLFDLTEEDLANVYKRIFDTADGQLMLEDLKNRCYVKSSSAQYGDIIIPHPFSNYFNEGMRSVVLHILSQINYKPKTEGEGDASS